MPQLLVHLIAQGVQHGPLPIFIKPVVGRIPHGIDAKYTKEELDMHFGFVEATLAKRTYFAGEAFSCADIQIYYPVEACLERVAGSFPHMTRWRELMHQRPAQKRALAEGGSAVRTDSR